MATKVARSWCFTSFQEAEPLYSPEKMKYMIYQREKSPTTGALHWQGFVQMHDPCRFTAIKKLIGDRAAHFEACRGSAEQNRAYCSKEESRVPDSRVTEHGKFCAGPGTRSDIAACMQAVLDGTSIVDIIKENPGTGRYIASMKSLRSEMIPESRFNPDRKIITLYGPAGCGKTRLAHKMAGGTVSRVPSFCKNALWFDGCHMKRAVLIDDFDPFNAPPLSFFKQFLDGYDFSAPMKGGFIDFCPDTVIITTNYHPDTWYPDLNFKNGVPLEGKDLEDARYPINRRIIPHLRDCYKTPITDLEFQLDYNVPPSTFGPLNSASSSSSSQ